MTDTTRKPGWIAADWGTSRLRLWAMAGREVLGHRTSDKGMGQLDRDAFEPALREAAGDWITGAMQVIACGMVGSRQGWAEATYAKTPCRVAPDRLARAPTHNPGLDVRIVPGISQASPPDVMRGEETQIAGFLARNPGWDGVACLPGTHTKWVHLSAGEVVSFQTFMTGEMFALLSDHSVLRHSVGAADWDAAGFAEGVSDGMARPGALAAQLFTLRAAHLLNGAAPATLRARLSGLLIGAELTAARPYWLGQRVALIGADGIAAPYEAALAAQGVPVERADPDAMVLAGLVAAKEALT